MTLWMLYAILFGAFAAGAGLALERGARAVKLPTRFAWLTLLVIAVSAPVAVPALTGAVPAGKSVEFVQRSVGAAGPMTALSLQTSWLDRAADTVGVLDQPLTMLWFALSALFLGRFVIGMLALRRQRHLWTARDIVGTECFVTPDIGPAVVAIPEARIVVPEWVLSLDPDSLATVIRHEREHKLARDGWLIVAGSIAAALMPWNPAVWVMRSRLRLAVEMDCDARVLANEPRVDRYGSLLLAIAQRPRFAADLAATLTESTSDLERRIDAMTARPPRHPRRRAMLFAAAGVAAIAIACSMPAPDMVAPRATDSQAKPVAAADVYFDFQVEKAVAVSRAMPPRYPDQLRAANISGSVVAKFVVDTTGRVDMRTFAVIKSDHEQFTTAVREALPDMRFNPARVGGHAVKQLVQMPFTFSLVSERASVRSGRPPEGQPMIPRLANVVYEVPGSDSMPEFLYPNTPPSYPNQLRAANIEGMVQARFVVREDGKIDMGSFMVIRSDHRLFEASVRAAAGSWRFRPAMKDRKPVSAVMQMPFKFTLTR